MALSQPHHHPRLSLLRHYLPFQPALTYTSGTRYHTWHPLSHLAPAVPLCSTSMRLHPSDLCDIEPPMTLFMTSGLPSLGMLLRPNHSFYLSINTIIRSTLSQASVGYCKNDLVPLSLHGLNPITDTASITFLQCNHITCLTSIRLSLNHFEATTSIPSLSQTQILPVSPDCVHRVQLVNFPTVTIGPDSTIIASVALPSHHLHLIAAEFWISSPLLCWYNYFFHFAVSYLSPSTLWACYRYRHRRDPIGVTVLFQLSPLPSTLFTSYTWSDHYHNWCIGEIHRPIHWQLLRAHWYMSQLSLNHFASVDCLGALLRKLPIPLDR